MNSFILHVVTPEDNSTKRCKNTSNQKICHSRNTNKNKIFRPTLKVVLNSSETSSKSENHSEISCVSQEKIPFRMIHVL